MLIVGTDETNVETALVGGLFGCPSCGGVLGPWGHARWRVLRRRGEEVSWRPRRARCRARACRSTHVLLGDCCLVRRRDDAETIVSALFARATGQGYRLIAVMLGMSELPYTVRGWLRAFARRAEVLRSHFTRWAYALDSDLGPIAPRGGAVAEAMEAVGVAARAWVQLLGPLPVWAVVARVSGGALLCNASCPLPPAPGF